MATRRQKPTRTETPARAEKPEDQQWAEEQLARLEALARVCEAREPLTDADLAMAAEYREKAKAFQQRFPKRWRPEHPWAEWKRAPQDDDGRRWPWDEQERKDRSDLQILVAYQMGKQYLAVRALWRLKTLGRGRQRPRRATPHTNERPRRTKQLRERLRRAKERLRHASAYLAALPQAELQGLPRLSTTLRRSRRRKRAKLRRHVRELRRRTTNAWHALCKSWKPAINPGPPGIDRWLEWAETKAEGKALAKEYWTLEYWPRADQVVALALEGATAVSVDKLKNLLFPRNNPDDRQAPESSADVDTSDNGAQES